MEFLNHTNPLLSIPDDLLILILSFFDANEIENCVKTTCKILHEKVTADRGTTTSLWKALCKRTGKLLGADSSSGYRNVYFKTICVPVDSPSIQHAIERTLRSLQSMPKSTIISLMPGVYQERIALDTSKKNLPRNSSATYRFRIRSAFPNRGATLVHYDRISDRDDPCIEILSSKMGPDSSVQAQADVLLELEHLSLLHYTRGGTIWGGNTCVRVDGPRSKVLIRSCSVQSDSGRGIGKQYY